MNRLLVFVLLLAIAGCARPPQPTWTEIPSADQLLAHLQETTGHVYSLDAETSVTLTTRGKSHSSQQFLLVEKPNRVRADVLTGFGKLLLQLTSDGEQLAAFVQSESPGHFYRGPATDQNIARFTRMPLPINSLISLLLYDPPLVDSQKMVVEPQGERLQLTLENAERRQELLFNRQLQLVGCRYLAGGDLLLEVGYRKIGTDGFPRQIEINLAMEQTMVSLRFADLKTNPQIDPQKFVLQKPEKLNVEPLP